MVPSWTETLLEAGVEVVGRTRFCIHPPSSVVRVGGTKDWKLPRVLSLKADLLVLDREENPQFMSVDSGLPVWASHIRSLEDVAPALRDLSGVLGCGLLADWSVRWEAVGAAPACAGFPGIVEWGRRPSSEVRSVVYVIWRDPWMAVGPDTFIGSALAKTGYPVFGFGEKYPVVDFASFDCESTLILFSSEPYPFLRKREGLAELGFPYAFVDGESFSWFGVRALRFLESALFSGDAFSGRPRP